MTFITYHTGKSYSCSSLFTRYNGSMESLEICGMVPGLEKGSLPYPEKLMRVRFDDPGVCSAIKKALEQLNGIFCLWVANS
jgi:hypothetical protein